MKYGDVTNTTVHFYPDAMEIEWEIYGVGFGTFCIGYNSEAHILIDNEAMSRKTIMKVLKHIVDNAEMYNESK